MRVHFCESRWLCVRVQGVRLAVQIMVRASLSIYKAGRVRLWGVPERVCERLGASLSIGPSPAWLGPGTVNPSTPHDFVNADS